MREGEYEGPTEFHRLGLPSKAPQSFMLTVIHGPDAPRKSVLAQASTTLVGQSPSCDVRLTDTRVSRRHLSLAVEGSGVHVVDLGSTNGTTVNGVSVIDAFLRGGETVSIGATSFQVAPDATAPAPPLSNATRFGLLIGSSPEIRRLLPLCERLAASDVPVVIEGETGTGKEVLAESIHLASRRAQGPFVVFDCTAIPANLMESELFGHEKGAFTGATSTRKGMFEQAEGGTLLIDEIGDLELSLQPKLLRAVERREIRRLGGDRTLRIDVRLLSATRRNLDREVQSGRFRDDLFHRLAVTRIALPPLRKRTGDVRALSTHFFAEFGLIPPDALLAKWEDEPWPGNVRELRNAVARWVAVGELGTQELAVEHTEDDVVAGSGLMEHVLGLRLPLTQAKQRVLEAFERRYIEQMLEESGGNVGRAAAAAGIGRRYFQMLLARRV